MPTTSIDDSSVPPLPPVVPLSGKDKDKDKDATVMKINGSTENQFSQSCMYAIKAPQEGVKGITEK